MAVVTHIYPLQVGGRYNEETVKVAMDFTQLLFTPDRLSEVTHPHFVERRSSGGISLYGLKQLQRKCRQFGTPQLHELTMLAVPPRRRAQIPGLPWERYTIDHLIELRFGLRPQDLLPEEAAKFPADASSIEVVLRMRWPYIIRRISPRDTPVPGADPDQLWVFGHSYWPIGERGFLTGSDGQRDFMLRQALYACEHSRTMIDDGLIDPLTEIYRRERRNF